MEPLDVLRFQEEDCPNGLDNQSRWNHLKSWLVKTSADEKNWRAVAHRELNSSLKTRSIPGDGKCGFIRLVSFGRNHSGSDTLFISASSQRPIL
jgi:hypothetical protein